MNAIASSVSELKEKLPWKAKMGYGTIGLSTMGNVMFATWQMYFYTTFAGISLTAAGLIASIGTIIAAFIAPVWGYLSDRMYRTKLGRKVGRRRLTLLITIPGMFVFMVLQFIPGLPVWAYAVFNFLYWAVNGGFSTIQYVLPAEMTSNGGERAQLVGINQITVAVANILVSIVNTALFAVWGQDSWTIFFNMVLLWGGVAAVVLLVGVFTIQEHPYDEATDFSDADANNAQEKKVPLLKRIPLIVWNYVSAFSVKEFRNYLGMYLSQVMFRSVRGAILTYFLVFALGLKASDVSISQGFSFAFGIVLVGFFMWLNSKIGGTKAYRVGAIEAIVVFLLMFVLAQTHNQIGAAGTVTVWIILSLALNFGITGVVNATDYAYSFIPDVDEILTGKRREGQYASINSTIDNIFKSIEAIAITSLLDAVGFVEGSKTQPESVTNALTYIFVFVPIAFCLLGLFFSYRIKLDDTTRVVLAAEIDRLRSGGSKADVTDETKKVVEDLTGWSYEHCWGNNRVINFSKELEREAETATTDKA